MTWEKRLKSSDWRFECSRDRCGRAVDLCPKCKHHAHNSLWVDLKSQNQVIVVAQHAHFVRPGLLDVARNWYHRIRTVVVDPRAFEMRRVIEHREFLPADIRRIFDDR
jgi:hypothetical protein